MNAKGMIKSTLIYETPDVLVRRLRWTRFKDGMRFEGSKASVITHALAPVEYFE